MTHTPRDKDIRDAWVAVVTAPDHPERLGVDEARTLWSQWLAAHDNRVVRKRLRKREQGSATDKATRGSKQGSRVYRQGVSVYVIGTKNLQAAQRLAGISPETHRWLSTDFGPFVRRGNAWQAVDGTPTSEEKCPGVCFIGPISWKGATS